MAKKNGTDQLDIFSSHSPVRNSNAVLEAILKLKDFHKAGLIKGEFMPEDSNPGLIKGTRDNIHYFSLPMALNFQRISYTLWKSALSTYNDKETNFVFYPEAVMKASFQELQSALMKHKVALQPNKHVQIWQKISSTIYEIYNNDLRNLFEKNDYDIGNILKEVQETNKKLFPYLSGSKIGNYWLYVMTEYTDLPFINRSALSVAPDTHVIQSSLRLGLVEKIADEALLRIKVAEAWQLLLEGTGIAPIDVHTPLWLWSRNNFTPDPFSPTH